jgi:arsenate reductase
MAEGLLRTIYPERYESFSAGIQKTRVHPLVIKVMDEIGIDISQQVSKTMQEVHDIQFDYFVMVCDNAKVSCPFIPGKPSIHQGFHDPSVVEGSEEKRLNAFRKTRDEIRNWIKDFFG